MDTNFREAQYRLMRVIGILGLALPFLLYFGYGKLLPSMSHYYYSSSGIFFIGVLFGFSLVLFSYRGYPKSDKEKVSDDFITKLASIFALLAVLFPTECGGELLKEGKIIFCGNSYLFGYCENTIKNIIHLGSASLFLITLGYMCVFRFTLSNRDSLSIRQLYKWCGIAVWFFVVLMVFLFLLYDKQLRSNTITYAYIFWLETFAVWAFGIAWLVKGKIRRVIRNLFSKLVK